MGEKDGRYYQENREQILAKGRQRTANRTPEQKAHAKEVKRLYYEKNRESILARATKYQRDNPDWARLSTKKWAEANPDKRYDWGARNRLKMQQYCHTRRSLTKGGEQLSEQFIAQMLGEQDNSCNACGVSFDEAPMQLDHIIPLSKGGEHSKRNVQFLCRSCNCSKTDKMPIDWAFYFEATQTFKAASSSRIPSNKA